MATGLFGSKKSQNTRQTKWTLLHNWSVLVWVVRVAWSPRAFYMPFLHESVINRQISTSIQLALLTSRRVFCPESRSEASNMGYLREESSTMEVRSTLEFCLDGQEDACFRSLSIITA